MLVLPHTRWERTPTNASRCAMKHRTVSGITAAIVPALYAASEAFTLADAADVHHLASLEVFGQHSVANLGFVLRFLQANFAENFHGRRAGFLEMPGHGFVDPLRLHEFHQAQLRGFVAVVRSSAALHHHTWARLQNSAAHQCAVVLEDLRHSQLDSDNPVDCHAFSSFFSALNSLKLKIVTSRYVQKP